MTKQQSKQATIKRKMQRKAKQTKQDYTYSLYKSINKKGLNNANL